MLNGDACQFNSYAQRHQYPATKAAVIKNIRG